MEPASDSSTKTSTTESTYNPWPKFGTKQNKPVVVILIGMAGSGKTTFVHRLNAHVHLNKIPSYFINLDPACAKVPFMANIDIRDTLDYKNVMKKYNLGPNGGILTCLNLFATRIDKVVEYVEKKAPHIQYVFIDTPGQIEVFNWSASGTIITEAFSFKYPTVFAYVIDTPRSTKPTTFMSNMLYACSMLYKTKLPFTCVFNKIDVVSHQFALEWMSDYRKFEDAILAENSYMSDFTSSLSLMLEEFYSTMGAVGVSAMSGVGVDKFLKQLQVCAHEYETVFKPELEKRKAERSEEEEKKRQAQLEKLRKDLQKTKGQTVIAGEGKANSKTLSESLEAMDIDKK